MTGSNIHQDLIYITSDSLHNINSRLAMEWEYFKDAGPTFMKAQPPLKTNEKEVLSKEILKFIKKGYIAPPENKIRSLIKYFDVPKGILEGRRGGTRLADSVSCRSKQVERQRLGTVICLAHYEFFSANSRLQFLNGR
jgi:hypothetical protein